MARILRYNPRSRTTALPIVPISRSSADQRKGRCGRVEDGVCIRLYGEEDFAQRPQFTPPEIVRSNLADPVEGRVRLSGTGVAAAEEATFSLAGRGDSQPLRFASSVQLLRYTEHRVMDIKQRVQSAQAKAGSWRQRAKSKGQGQKMTAVIDTY